METWKAPPCNQNNDVPIHEAVWIQYKISTTFWIFPHTRHVSSENLFFAVKTLPRVMPKDNADFRVCELQLPKYEKIKIWTTLSICIIITGEYCFRGKKKISSWNLLYTSKKFKANTRSWSAPTAQTTWSKDIVGKKFSEHNSLARWHCNQKCIFSVGCYQYTNMK